jgi:HAMP domain-containing protein
MYDPDQPQRSILETARGPEVILSIPVARGRFPVNQGHYWVVFHQPATVAYAVARTVQRYVWLGMIFVFGLAVVLMLWLGRWANRRIARPVRVAGDIAGRVADGDLSDTDPGGQAEAGEVGDLLSAVKRMVAALRRLVGAIHGAADESAAMAAQISAATQQMSASTQEMTSTTQDLTTRTAEQAHLVRASAEDAGRIRIASVLAAPTVRGAGLTALARQAARPEHHAARQTGRRRGARGARGRRAGGLLGGDSAIRGAGEGRRHPDQCWP